MALLTDNFHSPLIRAYYEDQQLQALTFLITIGAKALLLEEQKSHELSDYHGIHEEAEIRSRMVSSERIRSIKRKILEKESIRVIKCGRNGKYRIIEVVVAHSKRNDTSIVWLSRYNYLKKFTVDKNTQISRLDNPPNHSIAQVMDISAPRPRSVTRTVTGTRYNWTSSSVRSIRKNTLMDSPTQINRGRNDTQFTEPIPMSSSLRSYLDDNITANITSNTNNPSNTANHRTATESPRTSLQCDKESAEVSLFECRELPPIPSEGPPSRLTIPSQGFHPDYPSAIAPPSEIVPIRLKNSSRVLDLFFFNHIEMEAFVLVLQRYSGLNTSPLVSLMSPNSPSSPQR